MSLSPPSLSSQDPHPCLATDSLHARLDPGPLNLNELGLPRLSRLSPDFFLSLRILLLTNYTVYRTLFFWLYV